MAQPSENPACRDAPSPPPADRMPSPRARPAGFPPAAGARPFPPATIPHCYTGQRGKAVAGRKERGMRAVVQRVSEAQVSIGGTAVGAIRARPADPFGRGTRRPLEAEAERLWSKISRLRVFEDADGKTNLALSDVGGSVLVVSQFTLFRQLQEGQPPVVHRSRRTRRSEPPLYVVRGARPPRRRPRGNRALRRGHAGRTS